MQVDRTRVAGLGQASVRVAGRGLGSDPTCIWLPGRSSSSEGPLRLSSEHSSVDIPAFSQGRDSATPPNTYALHMPLQIKGLSFISPSLTAEKFPVLSSMLRSPSPNTGKE